MKSDPDRACLHKNFGSTVEVNRIVNGDLLLEPAVIAFSADIRVWCNDCDEVFRWVGVPAGISPARPMCSVDESELRAPIRPASSDPDFGMGIPGFAVTYTERSTLE